MAAEPLFSVRDFSVEYHTRGGDVRAVDSVNLDIRRGEILGLVGESACGKSTLGKGLMRLHRVPARITGGRLLFDGRDLMTLSEEQMRKVRGGEIGMVFQDPMTSLDPVQRIIEHLTETVRTHEPATPLEEARRRAGELAEKLGIRAERLPPSSSSPMSRPPRWM
jgi:peptide/nickel transport system ATP-binding protein